MKGYLETKEFADLGKFLKSRRDAFNVDVYPEKEHIFRAFKECPLENLKAVIIGQDPYHTEGCATGLCFAYNGLGPLPPSLRNIHKEFEEDLMDGLDLLFDYSLKGWAKEGVLLINTALTVERGKPNVHSKQWKNFTNYLLTELGKEKKDIVYICWGGHAKKFIPLFEDGNHVITGTHPSPLGANKGGFFGTKPFSKTNEILKSIDKEPINWKR
jgi:uracil-DNA glycosylase